MTTNKRPPSDKQLAKAVAARVWLHPNWCFAQVQAALNWADPEYRSRRAASHKVAIERMQAGEGSIYVARVTGMDAIKIGWALDVNKRLGDLKADYSVSVELIESWPASLPDEKRLHRRLRSLRHPAFRSTEFYRLDVLESIHQ